MATLIKLGIQKRVQTKNNLAKRIGIDKDTVKKPELAMAHNTIPPGGKSGREYHIGAQVIYIIKGRVRWFIGPHSEELDMEDGDFLYIPPCEIHGNMNLSDTEPVEEITCHLGVDSFDDGGTVRIQHLFDKK
jgi:uncharacterized RmlC-like cupin family protein